MATLTISFNTVAGGSDYTVCYRPAGSSGAFTCITATSSPVVVTDGIECGVAYEVEVTSNCATSSGEPQTVMSNILECPPQAFCYTVSIYAEQSANNSIMYFPPGQSGPFYAPVNSLTFVSGYYQESFCSTQQVYLVDNLNQVLNPVSGGSITGGTVACTTDAECRIQET